MFRNYKPLKSLDLSSFKTGTIYRMLGMFQGCKKLQTIKLGNYFDASNVQDMSYLFYKCESLKQIDLKYFQPYYVTKMEHMFDSCISLTSLNLNLKYF
jgi:surface protein